MELHVGCAMWSTHPGRAVTCPTRCPRASASARTRPGAMRWRATPPSTRRRLPRWCARGPSRPRPDFRFMLKLPRPITHERRLADVADPVRAFLSAIEPLGPRAHTLWIQPPPSFGPADLGALAGFLRRLPREHRYCVEVRHREFFEDPRSGSSSSGHSGTSTPNGPRSTPRSCSGARRRARPNARHGPRSRGCRCGSGPSPPSPSSATSAGTTRPGRSRAGSTGSTRSRAGCARGAPRPSSSTPPTTSTRSSLPAGSTTTSGPWCPNRAAPRAAPDRAADALLSQVRSGRLGAASCWCLRLRRTSAVGRQPDPGADPVAWDRPAHRRAPATARRPRPSPRSARRCARHGPPPRSPSSPRRGPQVPLARPSQPPSAARTWHRA